MRGLRSASFGVARRLGLPFFHSGVNVTFLMRGREHRIEVVTLFSEQEPAPPTSLAIQVDDSVTCCARACKVI